MGEGQTTSCKQRLWGVLGVEKGMGKRREEGKDLPSSSEEQQEEREQEWAEFKETFCAQTVYRARVPPAMHAGENTLPGPGC